MANYDRRILVPYLRDVCSMEMLCRKLEDEVRAAKEQADKYNDWASRKYEDPLAPKHGDADDDAAGAMFMSGLIAVGGWFVPIIGPIITLVSALVFAINFFEYRASARKEDEIKNAKWITRELLHVISR